MKVLRSLLIGRSVECDICLDHDTVSRQHARLELLPGARLGLTDLGSSNGTSIAEDAQWRSIEREEVTPDQPVRFGEHEVQLRSLLEAFPAFAIVLHADTPGDDATGQQIRDALPRHEKPRRNPSTGDIEEHD